MKSDFKLIYKNRPTSIELIAKKFNNFTLAGKINPALTLFRMGLFRAAHVAHPLISAEISIFHQK